MRGERPRFQVKWWWVAMLGAGLLSVAAGLGIFLLTLVALAWLTATMLRLAAAGTDPEPGTKLSSALAPITASQLSSASDERLCELWTQTSEELSRSYLPSTIASYADLRQSILDELFLRNPAGVQRWLEDRAEQRELLNYLHDHHA